MAFNFTQDVVGMPAITDSSTTAKFPIGAKVTGYDSVYGAGEFIYAQTTVAMTVGQVATLDDRTANPDVGALVVAASRGPVAVAMAAQAIGSYGWFQIKGSAVIVAATAAAAAPAYLNAVAGSLISTVVAGQKVDGCVFKTANGTPSAGFAVAEIAYPSANGNG